MAAKEPTTEKDISRNLLDLSGGNRQKLERAFKTLVGGKPALAAPKFDAQVLAYLHELGFVVEGEKLSHPAFTSRNVVVPTGNQSDALASALKLAAKFPETEFHLPFIMAKAKLEKAARKNGQAFREPEPEYDEDGFLQGWKMKD